MGDPAIEQLRDGVDDGEKAVYVDGSDENDDQVLYRGNRQNSRGFARRARAIALHKL